MNTTKQLQYCYEDQTLDEMHTNKAQDHIGSDDGDEEILSLCDLPINCNKYQTSLHDKQFNSNKTDQPRDDHQQSPSGENQENIFEFFSEEWNIKSTTTNSTTPTIAISSPVNPPPPHQADFENIIFRQKNKLNSKTLNPETKNIIRHPKRSNSSRMTHRKFNHSNFTKSKSYSSSGTSSEPNGTNFVSPAAKSKLLLVLFGLPPKMPTGKAEIMSDIKIRQSRHAPSTFFPTTSGCADEEAVQVGRRRSENRMWKFIKAATCFGSQRREKLLLSD